MQNLHQMSADELANHVANLERIAIEARTRLLASRVEKFARAMAAATGEGVEYWREFAETKMPMLEEMARDIEYMYDHVCNNLPLDTRRINEYNK